MIKICFVCLGNICRSPMAEFVLKHKVKNMNLEKDFFIESRATSYQEHGNPIHYGTQKILKEKNIPFTEHFADRLQKEDYEKYDLFICMDESNIKNTLNIFGNDPEKKIVKLLTRDVKDPWYTGNFIETYEDIDIGTDNLIKKLMNK